MQHRQILRYDHLVMHWGDGFPRSDDVWLVYFKGNPRLFICRVESVDELGGNLVELQLHRVDVEQPNRYRGVVKFRFLSGDGCGIEAWEPLMRLNITDWYAFLNGGYRSEVWTALRDRIRTPPQPVPDGKGGYTKGTIAYSLSREYEGP